MPEDARKADASLEALWAEVLRTGKGLPQGLATLSNLIAELGELRVIATFVAMVERNALEGLYADEASPLTDAVMGHINPILRKATYTALHALRAMGRSEHALRYVSYQSSHIPPYWERPELLEGYLASLTAACETPGPT